LNIPQCTALTTSCLTVTSVPIKIREFTLHHRFSIEFISSFSNRLENYPQFLMLLFTGGLQYPTINAVAGLVWMAGRVSYSLGYYTGGNSVKKFKFEFELNLDNFTEPAKRMRGGYAYFGLLTMLGTTVSFALRLLGYL
jgi:glutathione S-transferase